MMGRNNRQTSKVCIEKKNVTALGSKNIGVESYYSELCADSLKLSKHGPFKIELSEQLTSGEKTKVIMG